jgi:3-phosphoshikimate 1-carboxyvinyltransferase
MEVPKLSKTFRGKVKVRGDKSISHRVIVLSGLSEGNTKIKIYNLSSADDVKRTANILSELGVEIKEAKGCVEVRCKGLYLNSPQTKIHPHILQHQFPKLSNYDI